MGKAIGTIIGTIIGYAIVVFAIGGIATACYNAIAWQFNLPQFSFWTITGVVYVLWWLIGKGVNHNKKESAE